MATSTISVKETGSIKEVKKNIAKIRGLSSVFSGQIVTFADATKGLVIDFTPDDILAIILGDEDNVRAGGEVFSQPREFKIPVGEGFIGRIVNVFAEPVDGKGAIAVSGERLAVSDEPNTEYRVPSTEYYPVFREAPKALDRAIVDSCLETGTKIIDAISPIAKGQRQLIIGDRMTGKTTIAIDAILNQKEKNVICLYCVIGKSYSSLLKAVRLLRLKGAMDYTIVLASTASTSAGEQYLAPYSACALGEYFMHRGRDVLVVFDDMTKHAWSYRQLSLLLERPPEREAYPGDVYYIHSQLMERAGKLRNDTGKGGSMTFLPIVETLQGDVTGFIPSNLISMTDGQIYLSLSLFAEGLKPPVDMAAAVSIIGSKVQNPILRDLTVRIRSEYAQYKEVLRLTKLKTTTSDEARRKIHRGESLCAIFSQYKNKPISIEELILLLYAFNKGALDTIGKEKIKIFNDEIWGYVTKNAPEFAVGLQTAKGLTPEIKEELNGALAGYFN